MTVALDLLARCRALGIDLTVGPDGTLAWEADDDPPPELMAALSRHKAEVLSLIRADGGVSTPCARPSPPSPAAASGADWGDDDFARVLEVEAGLAPGSLSRYDPVRSCPGCGFCVPTGTEPAPRRADDDLASVLGRIRLRGGHH